MGKHRTVFLVSVGETKGTPHIGLHLTKIRVQLISSDLLVEKQLICGEDDLLNLLLSSSTGHNREHLAGQGHSRAALEFPFQSALAVIIVTVKEAAVLRLNPLRLSDMFLHPRSHASQNLSDLP